MVENHPEYTMGSFEFHRDFNRLEKVINMSVRRYWLPKPLFDHMERRRKQFEKRESEEMIFSVDESIKAAQDKIVKNGYNFAKFVNDVFDVLFKEGLQSVLRIGSAHNKGGPPNINIVQISHFSNTF